MGKAAAELFSKNGDKVYIAGRRKEQLEAVASANKNVVVIACDLTKPKEIENLIGEITKNHKVVDVLVNCVGGSGKVEGDDLESAYAAWKQIVDTNLNSAFLISHAILPILARPGGRLIHVTSMAAFAGSSRVGGEAYAASKSGVHGLVRTLVRVHGPQGITINCVAPGVIENTDFFKDGTVPQDIRAKMIPQIPAGRLGVPEDVAPAIFYLASDEASFINGEILNINGGQQFSR